MSAKLEQERLCKQMKDMQEIVETKTFLVEVAIKKIWDQGRSGDVFVYHDEFNDKIVKLQDQINEEWQKDIEKFCKECDIFEEKNTGLFIEV